MSAVLCLGKFDALHLGHRSLVEAAAQMGSPSMLRMTGMAKVLGWPPRPPLVAEADRPRVLAQWGAVLGGPVRVVLREFAELRRLDPAAFVDLVVREHAVAGLVCGPDFRFGCDRVGTVATLQRLGNERGIAVRVVEPCLDAGEPVSSTRIRAAIDAGAVETAARLYGRPHRLAGSVVTGEQRGRQIGFPTANLGNLVNLAPGRGVYAAWARFTDGAAIPAAVNIGRLPTLGDGRPQTVEAHLLDWDGDCYGAAMSLDFVARLRGERRFDGLAALRAQIAADVTAVRAACGIP